MLAASLRTRAYHGDCKVVRKKRSERRNPLQSLLQRVLEPQRSVQWWGVMRLEGTEAHIGKRITQEPAKTLSREVLVTESNRHVRIEDRVVAIRFDDQGGTNWSQHPAVLLERSLRRVHVMEGVLRVHDVEGLVLEGKMLGVSDLEREPVPIAPGVRRFHIDRADGGNALAEQARNSSVAAPTVEQGLVTGKREAELVYTPEAIAELAVLRCLPGRLTRSV